MSEERHCNHESDHVYSDNGTMHLPECKSLTSDKVFPAMDIKIKQCKFCGIPDLMYRVAYALTY